MEAAEAVSPPQRMTVEEYLAFEERNEECHEYRDGLVVAMTGHSRGHGRISRNVSRALDSHLEGGPCEVFEHGFKLCIEAASHFVYPDIMVVCEEGGDADKFTVGAKLVVEVLSPSTRDYDKGKKFKIYRQLESLEEYVLVDSERRVVESFHVRDGVWSIGPWIEGEGELHLRSFDLTLSLEQIYKGTSVGEEEKDRAKEETGEEAEAKS